MATILTLADARFHLRVGDEAPDATLEGYINAAQAIVEDALGRPILDALLGWPTLRQVPPNVLHAVRVALTDIYENREAPLGDDTDATIRRLVGRWAKVSFA